MLVLYMCVCAAGVCSDYTRGNKTVPGGGS